jgi:cell division inhibitor SepF
MQESREEAPRAEKKSKPQTKITPISRNRKQGAQGMEVCVIKPNSIEDEIEISETLLNGRPVIINMEGLSVDVAQRIIDFSSGATFAMHGNLQKISNYIFLATPNGIDISGDIQNIMESFDIPGFTM